MTAQILSKTPVDAVQKIAAAALAAIAALVFPFSRLRDAHLSGREAMRLMAMTDAQLAARGLSRDAIAAHAYRGFCGYGELAD